MAIRVEFLLETDTGITRAYVWKGMQIIGKKPFAGTLTSHEKVQETQNLIKEYTEKEKS